MAWKAAKRTISILLLALVLGALIGAIAAGRLQIRLPHW